MKSSKAACATFDFLTSTDMNRLHTFLVIGCNAYDEYCFVPWLNKTVYRRTVDLKHVCLQ